MFTFPVCCKILSISHLSPCYMVEDYNLLIIRGFNLHKRDQNQCTSQYITQQKLSLESKHGCGDSWQSLHCTRRKFATDCTLEARLKPQGALEPTLTNPETELHICNKPSKVYFN